MTSLPPRYRRNVVTSYLNSAVQAALALVMTPFLVHSLGKNRYGIWVLAINLVLYLEVLEFGFARTTIKFVAEHDARGDREGVKRSIATSFGVLSIPGLLALTLGIALAALFPTLFHLAPALATPARVICLLLAFDLALSIPSDTFGGTLSGLQHWDLLNMTLIGVSVSQAVAWVIVLRSGGGLTELGIVTVALSLLGQLSRFLLVRGLIGPVPLSRDRIDRRLAKRFTALSIWFFMRDVSEIVVQRIDTFVVGIVVGVAQAGIYAVGQKLSLLVERMVMPALDAFFPRAAELYAKEDTEGLRDTITAGTRIALGIAGPVCLTLAVLAGPAIRIWVGASFRAAAPVVVFLSSTMAIEAAVQAGLSALHGVGEARAPALILGGEATVNLTLSVILGTTMGLQGVALATLLASALFNLFVLLPYICRRFEMSLGRFLAVLVRTHAPAAAAAGGVAWLVTRDHIGTLLHLLAAGAAIAVTYLAVFWLTGLEPSERVRLRSAARGFGGRRHVATEPVSAPEGDRGS